MEYCIDKSSVTLYIYVALKIKSTNLNKMKTNSHAIKELTVIPGIGKSIANDLVKIGINRVADLKGKNPVQLYDKLNKRSGFVQDKCLLYAFRCAVYYAETPKEKQKTEKLKWWNWKD